MGHWATVMAPVFLSRNSQSSARRTVVGGDGAMARTFLLPAGA
ncbi:protein of unassigned function [Methylobacterium oryzae CBMB20]|uniref:Protein of unassigned function n=1 Tax=Methylobacterium oryzae CBMB20 TaxID=693986 RepID=A0A089NL72_9HYPH|nr:protein of unassigned function [Methylobacterium oryzae CBMB20]